MSSSSGYLDQTSSGRHFLLATLLCASTLLSANPIGPNVVNGTVNFSNPTPGALNVTNSPNAIINWQGFSIQQHEVTRFIQQSANSAVLNRVIGNDLSRIQGQLLPNGRVFLINPHGIVFGPNATVDTAGFIASTLNLADEDFLSGNLNFVGDENSGAINNQGLIKAGANGDVLFIAPDIKNSGVIETDGGDIVLAAGESVRIISLDDPAIQFDVQSPDNSVVNLGKLLATGGDIKILGERVALIEKASVSASGKTYVGEDVAISADAVSNGDGGKVIVWADETTQVYGGISARGGEASGDGGFVETSGKKFLEVTKAPDFTAPNGEAGIWLLDPEDITISTAVDSNITGTTPFSPVAAGASNLDRSTLLTALSGGGTIIVDTTGGGSGTGDITISNFIQKTTGTIDATLELRAHNNINIHQDVTSTSGILNLVLNADQDNSGGGAINLGALNQDINTNGGVLNTSGDTVNIIDDLTINNTDWTNTGAVNWSSASSLSFNQTITNQGDFNINTTDAAADLVGGGTFVNEGTLTKLAVSTVDTEFRSGVVFISNSGSEVDVEAGAGALLFRAGSTHNGSITFSNQGPMFNNETHTFNAAVIGGEGFTLANGVANEPTFTGTGLTTLAGTTITLEDVTLDTDWTSQGAVNFIGSAANHDFTINPGTTFTNQGDFNVNNSHASANIIGTGTFSNEGTLTLDTSLGIMSLGGDLVLGANSILDIKLGGLTQGTQYDFIDVAGNASLGGALDLKWNNNFTASNGNTFDIVECSGGNSCMTGAFVTINDPIGVTAASNSIVNAGTATPNIFRYSTDTVASNIYIWDNNVSGLWNVGANWDQGTVPGTGDYVLIDQPGAITITSNDTRAVGTMQVENDLTISGGTFTVENDSTVDGRLTLNGSAVLSIGADLDIDTGGFDWEMQAGSTVSGVGALSLSSGTTSSWNDGSFGNTHHGVLDGSTISNAGAITFSQNIGNGVDVINGGTFNNQSGGTLDFTNAGFNLGFFSTTADGVFNNYGTVNKNVGGGTVMFNTAFNSFDGSTVDRQAGDLQLNDGGVHSGTLTFNNMSPVFNSGTHILSDGLVINGQLVLSNDAVLSLGGNVTVNTGGFDWEMQADSTVSGAGTLSLSSGTTSSWNDGSTGNTHHGILDGATINNAGAITFSQNIGNGVNVINGGTFNNQSGGTLGFTNATFNLGFFSTTSDGVFNNYGTVNKNVGGGPVIFDTAFNSYASSNIDVQTGTLRLGDFSVNDGTINLVTGATVDINTAGTFTNSNTGVIQGTGTLDVAGTSFTNGGLLNPGGTVGIGTLVITGDVTFGSTSVLAIEATGSTIPGTDYDLLAISGAVTDTAGDLGTLDMVRLGNYAPATSDTLDFLTYGNGSSGVFTTVNDMFGVSSTSIDYGAGTGSDDFTATLTANGNLTVWTGASSTDWTVAGNWTNGVPGASSLVLIPDVTNAPQISATSETITSLEGQDTLTLGFSTTAGLIISDTLNYDGNIVLQAGDLTVNGAGASILNGDLALSHSNSALSNAGSLTINGDVNWTSGAFNGLGDVTVNGVMTVSGSENSPFPGHRRINSGKIFIHANSSGSSSVTGGFAINSGTTFRNASGAQLNFNTSGGLDTMLSTSGVGTFDNQGLMTKSGGSNLQFLTSGGGSGISITNSGTIQVNSETIQLNSTGSTNSYTGGEIDIVSGATFQMAQGTHTFTGGDVTGTGTFSVTNGGIANLNTGSVYSLTGSTVVGAGGSATLNISQGMTFASNFTLSSGDLNANANVVINGDMGWSTGDIGGSGTLTTNGTTTITSSPNTLAFSGWLNEGTVDLEGILSINAGETFTNSSAGIFNYNNTNGSSLIAGAGASFINNGIFNKTVGSAATATIDSDIAFDNTLTGTINVDSGALNVALSGNSNSGSINVATGTTFGTGGASIINTGVIGGFGTINVGAGTLTNNGTIKPGSSPGTLTITGDLSLSSSSVIDIEIEGTTQGTQYDYINVSGTANLDGTLNVTLPGAFNPTGAESFQIISCGTACSGTFANALPPSGKYMTTTYNANDVTISSILDLILNSWTGAVNTLWTVAGNWTAGVPDNTHTAEINTGGAFLVDLNSATGTAFSLLIGLDDELSTDESTLNIIATLNNQGKISLPANTNTSAINTPSFTNTGTIEILGANGHTNLNVANGFTNDGIIDLKSNG